MKKKLVALLLVSAMTAAMVVGCGSGEEKKTEETKTEETAEKKDLADDEYQYVSAEDTVKAKDVHILDVREWEKYVAGRVANSEWCPIFPLEDTSLEEATVEYAKANLNDGKDIYIVCNSGKRGAEKTTGILREVGIEPTSIYTVEGGAEALSKVDGALTTNRADEAIEWQYVSGKDAVEAGKSGEAQIVDVRDDETYKAGHLADSQQVNLKEIESADAQTAMFELAGKLDKEKPVYFLCYSGNKCAKTGISVLKDAGFDLSNLYIIENGAKDGDVSAAFEK